MKTQKKQVFSRRGSYELTLDAVEISKAALFIVLDGSLSQNTSVDFAFFLTQSHIKGKTLEPDGRFFLEFSPKTLS